MTPKIPKTFEWDDATEEVFQDLIDAWWTDKARKRRLGRRRPSENKFITALVNAMPEVVKAHPEVAETLEKHLPVDHRYKRNR